jgi:methylenetetrahydrofolate dehydrogenase (NADP+)/methenyltetrahydrofolate cyclohydrolase
MIINGKQLAQEIENDLSAKFKTLPYKKVVFVMFGDNAASRQFMGIKSRVAEQIGINAEIKIFPESVTTEEAVSIVAELSNHYDGVVVQLPLPSHLDVEQVLNAVPAEKDIDVLGSISLQQSKQGISNRVPPVAAAVHYVLDYHNMIFIRSNIHATGWPTNFPCPTITIFSSLNVIL